MSDPERSQSIAQLRFWAALVMAAGALVATLCGGCALLAAGSIISSFTSNVQPFTNWALLLIPAVVGGVPALVGVFVFGFGLKMYRDAGRRRSAVTPRD
jgi:hypothetical protein